MTFHRLQHLLRHEEPVAALASPDLGVVLLLRQGAVRAADGDVNWVAGGAAAALALAGRRRGSHQQPVPVDGVRCLHMLHSLEPHQDLPVRRWWAAVLHHRITTQLHGPGLRIFIISPSLSLSLSLSIYIYALEPAGIFPSYKGQGSAA
jgi:hypothetical protein